jgi:anti-anti-sigma factor
MLNTMRIEIEASTSSGQAVIQLHGKLDANTAMIVEQTLLSEIAGGNKNLVIDCANMDFISSAGLKALIMAIKKTKVFGGTITLVALQKNVKEVLDVSGMLPLFIIQDTRGGAAK